MGVGCPVNQGERRLVSSEGWCPSLGFLLSAAGWTLIQSCLGGWEGGAANLFGEFL